jgi:hypothetical protein
MHLILANVAEVMRHCYYGNRQALERVRGSEVPFEAIWDSSGGRGVLLGSVGIPWTLGCSEVKV